MESINWLRFLDIMELTADRIENDKNLLLSLLKVFNMFKIKCWWNKKEKGDLKQTVEKVAIRCSKCVYLLETNYQEIITSFLLNTMLHHVGMI